MMNILPEHKLLIPDVRQNGPGPAFMAHFGTRETFRLSAQPLIGDLTTHIGRGAHDHTEEWRQRARQRR
jgi:hypothetical protein